jgi:hypothetical protein
MNFLQTDAGRYILSMIVPLFPTLFIYKLFPQTQINVSGPLNGLTVNATGAIAGYMVISLIGLLYLPKQNTVTVPKPEQNWEIQAQIMLEKEDGNQFSEAEFAECIKSLDIQISPQIPNTRIEGDESEHRYSFDLSEQMIKDTKNRIRISIGQGGIFSSQILKITNPKYKRDSANKTINLGVISLKQRTLKSYNETSVLNPIAIKIAN